MKLKSKHIILIRRIHLYLGLSLLPWIILYGVTAIMFNHSDWFTERTYWTLEKQNSITLPEAQIMAKKAVKDLGIDALELVNGSAQWLGSISFIAKDSNSTTRVHLHPRGLGGTLRLYPPDQTPPSWVDSLSNWGPFDDSIGVDFTRKIQSVVAEKRSDIPNLTLKNYPTLRFKIKDKGTPYIVELSMDGAMEVEKGTGNAPLRNKLLRLHTIHGNHGYAGARSIWIRIVDIMGFSMILWGFTGIIMWWTVKPTRKKGAIALLFGFILIGILSISLWTAMGMN